MIRWIILGSSQIAGYSYENVLEPENKYKYNGIEEQSDLELNVYAAKYRTLDPAIGRWWQVDPLADSLQWQSPYNGMDNNPIRYNDPKGDCPTCIVGAILGGTN